MNTSLTGINESLIEKNNITVYPNPTENYMNIKVPIAFVGLHYKITDVFGKTIETNTISNESLNINLNDHSNGLYLLQIIELDKGTIKILKK